MPLGIVAVAIAACGGNGFSVGPSADGGDDAPTINGDETSSQDASGTNPVKDADQQEAAPSCPNGEPLGGQCCGSPPGGGTCVVATQCGCPANQKCSRDGNVPETCVDVGTAPAAADCTFDSDCQAGYECANGLCEALCGSCPANWECLPYFGENVDGGSAMLGYSVCEPHCNPVTPFTPDNIHEACGSGQRCNVSVLNASATYCSQPAGAGVRGTPCTENANCAAGYVCVTPPGKASQCEQYCVVGLYACFPLSCTSLSPELHDGTTQIGVCQ